MLNPNQGKEQIVQTTFPPPYTIYSCNSLSSAALNKASWDPTSRKIRAEACSRSVGLKCWGGGGETSNLFSSGLLHLLGQNICCFVFSSQISLYYLFFT